MKSLILWGAAALTIAALAANMVVMTAEEHERHVMKLTGGIVRKPNSGRGRILILNAQDRVGDEAVRPAIDAFNRFMHLPIEIRHGKMDGAPNRGKAKATGAGFVIFLIDDADIDETAVVAPESGWGYVNVAQLAVDEPTPTRLAERVQKETVRAFGWLCGAANSDHAGTVMGPVAGMVDLDRILLVNYPLDAYNRTIAYLEGRKVRPYKETTYAEACREGWADEPTNEYQKAIWNQEHQMPANPMKIEFDPKKGR